MVNNFIFFEGKSKPLMVHDLRPTHYYVNIRHDWRRYLTLSSLSHYPNLDRKLRSETTGLKP